MLICADAPLINNPAHHYRPRPQDGFVLPSLPTALEGAGLTWGNYGGYAFHYIAELASHPGNHTRDLFAHHASKGDLPSVSWVYGDGRPDLSEHPVQNVTDGMRWTVDQISAIVAGGPGNTAPSLSPGMTGEDGLTTSNLQSKRRHPTPGVTQARRPRAPD